MKHNITFINTFKGTGFLALKGRTIKITQHNGITATGLVLALEEHPPENPKAPYILPYIDIKAVGNRYSKTQTTSTIRTISGVKCPVEVPRLIAKTLNQRLYLRNIKTIEKL